MNTGPSNFPYSSACILFESRKCVCFWPASTAVFPPEARLEDFESR